MHLGIRLLKISAVYLAGGILLGLFMGVSGQFTLMTVHAHMSLLGWLALGFAGITYLVLPSCAETALARIHYWGHNVSLPAMMASLAAQEYGLKQAGPLLGLTSVLVVVSVLVFVANVLMNARPARIQETRS